MRLLNQEEIALLRALVSETPQAARFLDSLSHMHVEEMHDGGMGSLKFVASDQKSRNLGKTLIEKEFTDSDGTPITVAINLDENGDLFELDIWKVDFSSVKRFPVVDA
jgi:hypothetical protein